MRPGEKLYEELLIGENPQPTSHPRIMKANERFVAWPRLRKDLEELRGEMTDKPADYTRAHLARLVPEFSPDKAVVDWVYLASTRLSVELETHVTALTQ